MPAVLNVTPEPFRPPSPQLAPVAPVAPLAPVAPVSRNDQAPKMTASMPRAQLDNAQGDHLAGLLRQSEVSDLALTALSWRDKVLKMILLLLTVAVTTTTFVLNGVDTGIDAHTISRATLVLSAISTALVSVREVLPGVKRAILGAAQAGEWRALAKQLEESVHHGVPASFKDAQAAVDQLSTVYTALSCKLAPLPEKLLDTAREAQARNAASREPRRQSVPRSRRADNLC
jgi:hypothetical protein